MDKLSWVKGEGLAIVGHTVANFSRDLNDYFSLGDFLNPAESRNEVNAILIGGLGEGHGRIFQRCPKPFKSKIFVYNSLQSVEKSAKELGEFVKFVRGKKRMKIIARSWGGIVARVALMRKYISEKEVYRIKTIGTPHQGTYVPLFLYPSLIIPSCREMLPNSNLIQELKKQKLPSDIEYLNCYSKSLDEFCIPRENLRWKNHRVRNLEIESAGHADILYNKEAWNFGVSCEELLS